MRKTFGYEKPTVRRSTGYFNPERLATFKLIFEAVCDELAIPSDAAVERELVATTIMATGNTEESEMILVTKAMEAIAEHRQMHSTTMAKSMENTGLEPQAGHGPNTGIHTEL